MLRADLIEQRQQQFQSQRMTVSVVCPVHNEQPHLTLFLESLVAALKALQQPYEIIVVDDGSRDASFLTALLFQKQHPHLKLLRFSRNFGKEIALTAGLEHASGDVCILMDTDFQHPLDVLPQFIEQWLQGHDMVYGIQEERPHESRWQRSLKHLFYRFLQSVTETPIPEHAGDFRLMDRCVVDAINQLEERNRFMKGLYAWVGFNAVGVPFTAPSRAHGTSRFGFKNLAELAITGITSFSSFPLRIWCFLGFAIAFMAFAYGCYVVADTLRHGATQPGFPTIVAGMCFLGGLQLFSIGILGEYIDRIFNEVKKRPQYILSEKIGFDTPA